MARIGIMTFLHNENCGSSLQALALQQTLRGMGHEPFGLDYRPSRAEKIRNLTRSGNSPAVVLDSLRRRRGHGERNTDGFDAFNRERLNLSDPAHNRRELAALAQDCDLLLAGSDQVWSPEWLNASYFFDFIDTKPRLSYACSLGVSVSPGPRKEEKLRRLCGGFRHISVREEEGRGLLAKLLPDRDIAVTPDPVFLRSKETWLDLAGRPENAPVLAAYFIKDDPSYVDRSAALARDTGLSLKPLAVTAGMLAQPGAVPNPAPLDWLREIAASSWVITDSFHGAAMAAILGKPLTILRRWKDEDPQSKNSRIDQLMRLLGWTQGLSCQPSGAVDARVAELREDGLSWLRNAIEESLEFCGKR